MEVRLIDYSRGGNNNVVRAMRRCHGKQFVGDPTDKDIQGMKTAVLKRKHMSLIEHLWATLEIVDVSRECVDQFRTHRHLSFSVESMRVKKPDGIIVPKHYPPVVQNKILASFYRSMVDYDWLIEHGVKPEDARRVAPIGSCTSAQISANARGWLEWLQKRWCRGAEWEIRELATKIREVLVGVFPVFFENIECPNCEKQCYKEKEK